MKGSRELMAFSWKEHKDIWKGEGIYFLTFAVKDRRPLLGTLVPIERSRAYCRNVERFKTTNGNRDPQLTHSQATVELTHFGFAVSDEISLLSSRVEGLTICAKQVMPDHLHFVVWIKRDTGRSIRQIGNGFCIGVKRLRFVS